MSIFAAPSFYNQADQNIYGQGYSFIPQERFRGGAFNFPTSATTTGTATGGINTLPINMGGGGGGSNTIIVQDEGSTLSTNATTLNFVGSGVVASGTGATKTVTITGGSTSPDIKVLFEVSSAFFAASSP